MDDTNCQFLPLHSLSVAADNTTTGIVEGSGEYAEGTVVILSALPNEGFQFAGGMTEAPRIKTRNRYGRYRTDCRILTAAQPFSNS